MRSVVVNAGHGHLFRGGQQRHGDRQCRIRRRRLEISGGVADAIVRADRKQYRTLDRADDYDHLVLHEQPHVLRVDRLYLHRHELHGFRRRCGQQDLFDDREQQLGLRQSRERRRQLDGAANLAAHMFDLGEQFVADRGPEPHVVGELQRRSVQLCLDELQQHVVDLRDDRDGRGQRDLFRRRRQYIRNGRRGRGHRALARCGRWRWRRWSRPRKHASDAGGDGDGGGEARRAGQ